MHMLETLVSISFVSVSMTQRKTQKNPSNVPAGLGEPHDWRMPADDIMANVERTASTEKQFW